MVNDNMLIRPYDDTTDREAVRDCFESGFGHTMWPLWKYAEARVIDDMIGIDMKVCSVNLVAEIDGKARGVLIGSTSSGALKTIHEIILVKKYLYRYMVFDRKAMNPFARLNLLRIFLGELPYYMHSPRGKAAEIVDLTTMEGYRGGVGRALVDAFVERARAAGLERVDVGTDTELAWGFYEKYGFKRVRKFPLHIYDYSLPGKKVTGYIYSLEFQDMPIS